MRGWGDADESVLKVQAAALETAFAGYEKILSKQAYLAGNELTVADLFHLPYGKMAKNLGYAEIFATYPAVDKWFNSISARESWVKATA